MLVEMFNRNRTVLLASEFIVSSGRQLLDIAGIFANHVAAGRPNRKDDLESRRRLRAKPEANVDDVVVGFPKIDLKAT